MCPQGHLDRDQSLLFQNKQIMKNFSRIVETASIVACIRFVVHSQRAGFYSHLCENGIRGIDRLHLQESKDIVNCFLHDYDAKSYSQDIIEKTKLFKILAIGNK
jgi:hypothetical protein